MRPSSTASRCRMPTSSGSSAAPAERPARGGCASRYTDARRIPSNAKNDRWNRPSVSEHEAYGTPRRSGVIPTIVSRLRGKRRRTDLLEELIDRERDVLALLAEGLSNHGIAQRLYLAERTVEARITQIFQKLALAGDPRSN